MNIDLSIIIPVYQEEALLRRCLQCVMSQIDLRCVEVIVVEGGEQDLNRRITQEFNCQYISAKVGRAYQLNRGALLSKGRWLMFLHADCIVGSGFYESFRSLEATVYWGFFYHRIDAKGVLYRIIEHMDNIRARYLELPYGDQAIFVRKDVFVEIGMFPEVPILEDLILARTLAKQYTCRGLYPILRSSARRWEARGIISTTLLNWEILFLYYFTDTSLNELASMYRNNRRENDSPK